MSKLREAAQAALEHWDKVSGIFRMTTETNRLRAALAQPEAHPPRDEWRPASEPPDSDRLVIVWVADDRSPSNGGYFCTDCLRPSRANPDARIWASIGVTHWRDVQPPTEESK